MKRFAFVAAGCSLLLIAGCNPKGSGKAATGPVSVVGPALIAPERLATPANVEAVKAKLRAATWRAAGGQNFPCSEYFEVLDVTPGDQVIDGGSGKLEASVTVRIIKMDPYFGVPSDCYGKPSVGLGQQASGRFIFYFEKWDSGWRLANRPFDKAG